MEPYLMIGIPSTGNAPIELLQTILDADIPCKWSKAINKGSLVSVNRDRIVEHAIASECTHIMWIDSDIVFPSDGIKKLLAHDTDIVSGIYFTKDIKNCSPCAWKGIEYQEDGNIKEIHPIEKIPTYGRVDLCGMGFCLIKIEVFKDVLDKYGCWYRHMLNIGEDFSFLLRAKACGYKVYVDGTINLLHLGTYGFSKADYDRVQMIKNGGIKC